MGFGNSLNFDTGENRNMHTFSFNIKLSQLTSELEKTYDDHLPFRSVLLRMSQNLEGFIEEPYAKEIEPFLLRFVNRRHAYEEPENTMTISDNAGRDDWQNETVEGNGMADQITEGVAVEVESDSCVHSHDFRIIEHRDADFDNHGYTLYRCDCGKEKTEYADKLVDTSYYPYKEIGNNVIAGRFGWLFYKETMDDYQCFNQYSAEELAGIANRLLTLRELCEVQDVDVKYLFFPNKNTIYPEYMPTMERGENSRSQQLEDYLKTTTDLDVEYIYGEMVNAKPYHQLYYKQDSHWNTWGALVGANTLYSMLGMPEIMENQLNPESTPRLKSDLLLLAGMNIDDAADDMDWNLHYKPEIESNVFYDISMERCYMDAVSRAANPKKVTMVGDSYNELLMSILACDFSQVTYINWKILDEVDPVIITGTDILVVDAVERSMPKVFGETAEKLIEIFS